MNPIQDSNACAHASRRRFLKTLGGACLLGAGLSKIEAQPSNTSSATVISKQNRLYHGWPTLIRRRNGELLLAYSGGREAHVCPFGRVELMRSRDDGQTWTWPQTLLDTAIDDRDAGLCETQRGTLLATTFTSLAYESILKRAEDARNWDAEKLEQWRAAHNRVSSEQRKQLLDQWMLRSEDGGLTWSKPYLCLVNSPHGPIPLSDGRLLYAGKELWTGDRRVGVCESLDDGKSWRWLSSIEPRPEDDASQYHELHAVESKSGKLIVHIRNHNPTHNRETLQSESTDGGRSWTTPRSIGVWGLPSHLLRLPDDRLLMTYGYRREPYGIQSRVSSDEGESWSEPVPVYDQGTNVDLGYPSTVVLSDERLLTVWYEKPADSRNAQLNQAHWTLP